MLVATETSLWIVAKTDLRCLLAGFSAIRITNSFAATVWDASARYGDSAAISKLLQLSAYVFDILNIEYGLSTPTYFTEYYIHDGF